MKRKLRKKLEFNIDNKLIKNLNRHSSTYNSCIIEEGLV